MALFSFKFIMVFYLLFSLIVTLSMYIPPRDGSLISVLSLLIPLNLFFGLLSLFFVLFNKKTVYNQLLIGVIALIFFINIYQVFGAFSLGRDNSKEEKDFTVLSYNISSLHTRGDFSSEYDNPIYNSTAVSIKDYLLTHSADIICVQELWDDDSSSLFNISKSFNDRGYDHYVLAKPKHIPWRKRGLGIFSKYPIIKSGEIFLSENNFNGAAYADIAIQDDTVRVINVHLQSLQINLDKYWKVPSSIFLDFNQLAIKVKKNQIIRFQQLQEILAFADNSPYSVVISGDFNEPHYSYLYQFVEKRYNDSFRHHNWKVVPTFHYKLLQVKIDYQFANDLLYIVSSEVQDHIDFTYHYPLEAKYHF